MGILEDFFWKLSWQQELIFRISNLWFICVFHWIIWSIVVFFEVLSLRLSDSDAPILSEMNNKPILRNIFRSPARYMFL